MLRRALIALAAVVILFSGVVAGLWISRWGQKPSPTPTVSPTQTPFVDPSLRLEPNRGKPGAVTTVIGEAWPPRAAVSLYLGYSRADALSSQPFAQVVADGQGHFEARLNVPPMEIWDRALDWFVLARAGGFEISALFSIPNPPATPTTTPKATSTVQAIRLEGTVETIAVEVRLITVRSKEERTYAVNLPREAAITAVDGRPLSLADMRRGDKVVVEGFVTASGVVSATRVIVGLQPPTSTPTQAAVVPTPVAGWRGEYFNNDSLAGQPALVRIDEAIAFDWGQNAPAPGINRDRFSARWTRTLGFKVGGYRFFLRADDGVRLWVGNRLVLNEWRESAAKVYTVDLYLAAGQHALQVDYFEAEGDAVIAVWWEPITSYPDWKGEYYNNVTLSGDPALLRNDLEINFDWGSGSPAEGINTDLFSVRWRRVVSLQAGNYRFYARADDGLRLWVAGVKLLDEWHDAAGASYEAGISLTGGSYEIVVEYYENAGQALIRLWWERLEDRTATPTATQAHTSTPSAVPTATPSSTGTSAPTSTPVVTSTPTNTPIITVAPTGTPTATSTVTPMPTSTLTPTRVPTATPTRTRTSTAPPIPTWTPRPAFTPTRTATAAFTPTSTRHPTITYVSPVDAFQTRYFPFARTSGMISQGQVSQLAGRVYNWQSSDFPQAPFFRFDLRLDSGEILTVEGGPELVTMSFRPAMPSPPVRETPILPGKDAAISVEQISPEQQTATPLADGTRASVVGFWNGRSLVAERVDIPQGAGTSVWYYRSFLLAEELRPETVGFFKDLAVYVRAKGADVAALAPEVDAEAMAIYRERAVIVHGVLRVGQGWQLQNVRVYTLDRMFYRRIYPPEETKGRVLSVPGLLLEGGYASEKGAIPSFEIGFYY